MRTLTLTLIFTLMAAGPVCRGAENRVIADKTLVAWVAPANLTQRGGGVLSIEKSRGVFDAIVFGELATSKWMAGSNGFTRSKKEQESFPVETADSETLVQIAVVYRGKQITIYRNGSMYADYTVKGSERFGGDSFVLLGLRHVGALPENRFFTGSIDDARLYDVALDAQQIAALKPNEPSDPKPVAWWDFEDGRAADRMKLLPASTLLGDARIADGRLQLDRSGAYLMASKAAPQSAQTAIDFSNANGSARALREHLLGDPFRPGYHFVVPEGRCMPFDPNGAIYWKGRYHLFYIFQDKRGHNWGHVSSTDLFHWRHHPTGLVSGMFSGNCFINKDGRPTMCYHQVGQGNAMAVAVDDELNEWKKLKVDTTNSSLTEGPKSVEAGPLELATDEPLRLRVFVDKSVVEVFANGRQAVMRRIYPSREDSVGVTLFSNAGPASVTTLEAWDMMRSNPY